MNGMPVFRCNGAWYVRDGALREFVDWVGTGYSRMHFPRAPWGMLLSAHAQPRPAPAAPLRASTGRHANGAIVLTPSFSHHLTSHTLLHNIYLIWVSEYVIWLYSTACLTAMPHARKVSYIGSFTRNDFILLFKIIWTAFNFLIIACLTRESNLNNGKFKILIKL